MKQRLLEVVIDYSSINEEFWETVSQLMEKPPGEYSGIHLIFGRNIRHLSHYIGGGEYFPESPYVVKISFQEGSKITYIPTNMFLYYTSLKIVDFSNATMLEDIESNAFVGSPVEEIIFPKNHNLDKIEISSLAFEKEYLKRVYLNDSFVDLKFFCGNFKKLDVYVSRDAI